MANKNKSFKIRRFIILIALYLSLPLFLFFTNPQKLPLPLVITPIVLLFLIFYATAYYIIKSQFKQTKRLSKTRMIVISAIIALVPVLLIVLASIQQFTLRDIILSTVIVVCVSWYLLKVDFLKS